MVKPDEDESDDQATVVIAHFTRCFLDDQSAGRSLDLERYLSRYPGFEDDVSSWHRQLVAGDFEQDESNDTEPLPERFGPYTVTSLIGRGGQGVVYRAEDTESERSVAIKTVSGLRSLSPTGMARFRREVRVLRRLSHPAISQLLEFASDDGHPYLVMELLEGESIGAKLDHWRQQKRPEATRSLGQWREHCETMLRAFREIALGLQHAHESDVLHRDVSPNNIFVENSGRAVLIDFGLAAVDESDDVETRTSQRFGTRLYMSPEQRSASPKTLDGRTDIYSLGLVLGQVLALADRPNSGPWAAPVLESREGLPRLERKRIGTVVDVATALRVEDRYSNAKALAEDLGALAEGRPVKARRVSSGRRLARWAVASPLSALTSFGTAILVFVLTVTLIRQPDASQPDTAAPAAASTMPLLRAQRLYDRGLFGEARRELEACSPEVRDLFSWRHLSLRSNNASEQVSPALPAREIICRDSDVVLASANGRAIIEGSSTTSRAPAPPPGSRLLALFEQGSGTWGRLLDTRGSLSIESFDPNDSINRIRLGSLERGRQVTHAAATETTTVLLDSSGQVHRYAAELAPSSLQLGSERILAVALSRDGRRLAVAQQTSLGLRSELILLDLIEMRVLLTSEDYALVDQISFALDDTALVLCSHEHLRDGEILLFALNAADLSLVRSKTLDSGPSRALHCSEDDNRIWVATSAGTVLGFDAALERESHSYHVLNGPVERLASSGPGVHPMLHGLTKDGERVAWSRSTGSATFRLPAGPASYRSAAASNEKLWLGTRSGRMLSWSLLNAELQDPIDSGDHRFLAYDETASAIHWSNGRNWQRCTADGILESSPESTNRALRRANFSRSGLWLMHPHDNQNALFLRNWEGDDLRFDRSPNGKSLIRFDASFDAGTVAGVDASGTLYTWDLAQPDAPREFRDDLYVKVAVDVKGQFIAAATKHGRVILIAAKDADALPREVNLDSRAACLRFAPSGRELAVGTEDHAVSLIDVGSADLLLRLEELDAAPVALAWAPNGERLIALGNPGRIQIWDSLVRSHRFLPSRAQADRQPESIGPAERLARSVQHRSPLLKIRRSLGALVSVPARSSYWYQMVLEAANHRLRDQPDDHNLLAVRGAALLRLGFRSEAREALVQSLAKTASHGASSHPLATPFLAMSQLEDDNLEAAKDLLASMPPASGEKQPRPAVIEATLRLKLAEGPASPAGSPIHRQPSESSPSEDLKIRILEIQGQLAELSKAPADTLVDLAWLTAISADLTRERYETALGWVRTALKSSPKPRNRQILAMLLYRLGQFPEASKLLEEQVSRSRARPSEDPCTLAFLALAEEAQGHTARARTAYNRFRILSSPDRYVGDTTLEGLKAELESIGDQ